MWDQLVEDHGEEFARDFARACLERPSLWLRMKERGNGSVPGSLRADAGGKVNDLAGFSEGEFIVQDISSQQLVHEISARVKEALGTGPLTALDLCAAPGGKSVGLAWEGFTVSASDRDSPRMKLLQSTEDRVRAGIQIVPKSEVSALPLQDLVWVDAPCTGSGIIRRHPDVRWLRQPKELQALAKVQAQLIEEGWEKVKPGGFLAYSVCSLLKAEGPVRMSQAALKGSQRIHEWLLTPQQDPHGDGFWASLVRKT